MRVKARVWDEKYAARLRKSFGLPPGEFSEEPGVFLDGVRLGCADEEKLHRLASKVSLKREMFDDGFYKLGTARDLTAALKTGAIPVTPGIWNQIRDAGINKASSRRSVPRDPVKHRKRLIDGAWDRVRKTAAPAEGWNKQARSIVTRMKRDEAKRRRDNFWSGLFLMALLIVVALVAWYSAIRGG